MNPELTVVRLHPSQLEWPTVAWGSRQGGWEIPSQVCNQIGRDLRWLSGQGAADAGNPFKSLESRKGSWKEGEGGT